MLLPFLILLIVILGAIVVYIYFLSPRLNPAERAKAFMDQNMFSEAEAELRKILEINPGDFKTHFQLGDMYFDQNMVDQGVIQFEELIRLNKFTHEIDKYYILRKLGKAYLLRDQLDKAFRCFYEIARVYPADAEALYHVAFISLGQEVFELAQKSFDRLVKASKDNSLAVYFGAGIASYQMQRIGEAAEYFRQALILEPHSDITNLAMGFALQKKRDYKTAINYAKMVAQNSNDQNALVISKRLLGILLFQAREYSAALDVFEELLDLAKDNKMEDEIIVILYDIGFVALRAEKTQQAYEYWNQLYLLDRNFRNVQHLTTLLRKEMDSDVKKKVEPVNDSVMNYVDDWLKSTFPDNFIWDICGLKSSESIDLKSIVVTTRISEGRGGRGAGAEMSMTSDDSERISKFCDIDVENFRIIANRLVAKLGYTVDEILATYREADGVDFMARSNEDNKKTLVWVRRWKGANIGEIPLRNFAQEINDAKVPRGLFITTSGLSSAAEGTLKNLSTVTVIYPEQVGALLDGPDLDNHSFQFQEKHDDSEKYSRGISGYSQRQI